MSSAFDQIKEEKLMGFLTSHFGHEVFTPGLERSAPLYKNYKNLFKQNKTKIITVGGTNGKGQTAHTISSLLVQNNYSVALWTSPHILSIRERFLFTCGSNQKSEEASYEEIDEAMQRCFKKLQDEFMGLRVSFYEFLFLVFLDLASTKEMPLDYIILEVGLGGRFDAVNHFDADCALITSISRDHQAILGNRYDQILFEKLGIARSSGILFTNFSLEYLNDYAKSYAKKHQIQLVNVCQKDNIESYFRENQKLAIHVVSFLTSIKKELLEGIVQFLPLYKGRREIMTFEKKSLIFIGAHNTDGIRRMLKTFNEDFMENLPDSLLISFSKRPIDEVEVMMKSLVEFFKDVEIKLTAFIHPKALSEAEIKEVCEKLKKGNLNFVFDWKSEIKSSKSQKILICGSYYFIGEVQRFITTSH